MQYFGGNADARVRDGKAQNGLCEIVRLRAHAENYFAAPGEFDGVANQVDEDLAESAGVAQEPPRHFRLNAVGQLQPLFLGSHRQGFKQVPEARAQIEFEDVELQLTRLDFGEIQNVVKDGEQRVR